jgi:uncharacterized membrane protein YbhN (UPF0104 family)
MNRLWQTVLPELRRFPTGEQPRALRLARASRLESLELFLLAIWLVLVTALVRTMVNGAPEAERVAYSLVINVVVTVPLLLAVFLPIHIRRLRRGLRAQLEERSTS